METKIRIRHIGWNKNPLGLHDGVVTVVTTKKHSGDLHMGFSFCAPGDCFSRKKGVHDALDRLEKEPFIDSVSDDTTVLRALCFLSRVRGTYYNLKPHFKTGEVLSWLPEWMETNFPVAYQQFNELWETRMR